jgi:hypothetical protein
MMCLYIPIGALTSKPYAFSVRSWELERYESVDFFDSLGSSTYVEVRGNEVMRVLPKINKNINGDWITDKVRFSYDSIKLNRIVQPLVFNRTLKSYAFSGWLNLMFLLKSVLTLSLFDLQGFSRNHKVSTYFVINEDVDFSILNKLLNFRSFSHTIFYSSFADSLRTFNFDFLNSFFSYDFAGLDSYLSKYNSIILLGCNLRYEMPLLYYALINKVRRKELKLYIFGSVASLNCSFKNLGSSIIDLKNLLFFRNKNFPLDNTLTLIGHYVFNRLDFSAIVESVNLISKYFKLFSYSFDYKVITLSPSNLLKAYNGLSFNYFDNIDIFSSFFAFNKRLSNFSNFSNTSLVSFLVPKLLFVYNSNALSIDSNFFDVKFYLGHNGSSLIDKYDFDFVLPTTYVYERDNLFLNFAARFSSSNFIVSPSHSICNDLSLLKFISSIFNKISSSILPAYFYIYFLNKSHFVVNGLSYSMLKGSFGFISSFYKSSFYVGKFVQSISFERTINFLKINRIYNSNFIGYLFNYYLTDTMSDSSKNLAMAYKRFSSASSKFYK